VKVEIPGQTPRHIGNVLYYLPTKMSVSGTTTFRNDLIRSTVIKSDAAFMSKDPYTISFGRGSATVGYRPTGFDGTLTVSDLAIGLNFGGDVAAVGAPTSVEPLASIPPACPNPPTADCGSAAIDGLPEVELFDATKQVWVRLPHLAQGNRYSVANASRYMDPASGSVLVRYVNDRMDNVGFSVDMAITGDVR
jgi:hypothetical protein